MQHCGSPRPRDQPEEHMSHCHSQPSPVLEQLKWPPGTPKRREQCEVIESWLSYYCCIVGGLLNVLDNELWTRGELVLLML